MSFIKFGFILLFLSSIITSLQAQTFVNGSFESWGSATTCSINVTPDNWINYSTGCNALDEANQTICPSTIPGVASNGTIYARACAGPDWQGGEGVYQYINNLTPGATYSFSFDYAGSNLYGGSDQVTWRVFIDDILVGQTPYFPSAQANWSTFTHSFTATLNTHKIGFRAYFIYPCVSCDGSAGIDNVKFNELPTGAASVDQTNFSIYPNPVQDELHIQNKGYDEANFTVYDIHGKEVMTQSFSGLLSITTQSLAVGIYVGVIRKQGTVVFKQTLIK